MGSFDDMSCRSTRILRTVRFSCCLALDIGLCLAGISKAQFHLVQGVWPRRQTEPSQRGCALYVRDTLQRRGSAGRLSACTRRSSVEATVVGENTACTAVVRTVACYSKILGALHGSGAVLLITRSNLRGRFQCKPRARPKQCCQAHQHLH